MGNGNSQCLPDGTACTNSEQCCGQMCDKSAWYSFGIAGVCAGQAASAASSQQAETMQMFLQKDVPYIIGGCVILCLMCMCLMGIMLATTSKGSTHQ